MSDTLRVGRLLGIIGEVLVEQTQASLISYDLKDSRLIKAVDYKIDESELQVSLTLPKYAAYVISGRAPGKPLPPEIPILTWIKRRGIRPKKGQSLNELLADIRYKIARDGIQPRPFVDSAVQSSLKVVERLIDDKFSTIVENQIQTVFDKDYRQKPI